jgi:hypothetical protein
MTPVPDCGVRIRAIAPCPAGRMRKKPFYPMPNGRRKRMVCNGKAASFTISVLRIFMCAQRGFPIFRR